LRDERASAQEPISIKSPDLAMLALGPSLHHAAQRTAAFRPSVRMQAVTAA